MGFNWKEFGKTAAGIALNVVAPTAASALGTPLAGMAMKSVSNVLLGKEDGSPQEIETAITNMTPADVVAMKKMDVDLAVELGEQGVDLEEIRFKDRDSARKLFSVDKYPQQILSYVGISGYFLMFTVLLLAVMKAWLPKESTPVLMIFVGMISTLVGVLTNVVAQIFTFWFGSSDGSRQKTKGLMDKVKELVPGGKANE